MSANQDYDSASVAGAIYVSCATAWARGLSRSTLRPSNTDESDGFGTSVALSGDGNTLAVGAYAEGSTATGIGANQADVSASATGAAYLY